MSRSRQSRERAARKAASKARHREGKRFLAWAGSGERCSTCAYRAGTVASGDTDDRGLTRLRRALLDACEPFFCHEGPGGRELAEGERKRLCIGHMDALEARSRAGYYDEHPPDAPAVVEELRAAYAERERIYREHVLALTTIGANERP